MGSLLLVRHGQASYGAADYDVLSPLGQEQAGVVGRALRERGVEPAVVLHGAMRRQRDTARHAVAAAGWTAPLEQDDAWDELDHEALLSRVPRPFDGDDHTPAQFQEWFAAASRRWYDGGHDADYAEPFTAFAARVEGALARAAARVGRGEVAVVVSSGGPIAWLTAHLLGAGTEAYARLAPVVVNTSVTTLALSARGPGLVAFNDHAHVQARAGLLTYR